MQSSGCSLVGGYQNYGQIYHPYLQPVSWIWSRVVIGLLTGHNTSEDTFTLWDWETVRCVGNVGQRRRQLMSCVSVKPWYTQTHLSGLLLFGLWGCQGTKSGGDLELYYKDRDLMTWTLAKGHKGPVNGLRSSGPQGLDPLFTHYSLLLLNMEARGSSESLVTMITTYQETAARMQIKIRLQLLMEWLFVL
jgi:hypothetical protein